MAKVLRLSFINSSNNNQKRDRGFELVATDFAAFQEARRLLETEGLGQGRGAAELEPGAS
jgi:hypothetical protein